MEGAIGWKEGWKERNEEGRRSRYRKQKERTRKEADVFRALKEHRHVVRMLAEGGTEKGEEQEKENRDDGEGDGEDAPGKRKTRTQEGRGTYWIDLERMDACLIDIVMDCNLEDRVRYGRQLASGLTHMHRMGFRHNDVKLDNVLIDLRTRTAKLCDLEHASSLDARMLCGTLSYMAPELFLGDSGEEVDSWSLGVCLFCLFHLFLPFERADGKDSTFLTCCLEEKEEKRGLGMYRTILSSYNLTSEKHSRSREVDEVERRPIVMDQRDWILMKGREDLLDLLLTRKREERPRLLDERIQILLFPEEREKVRRRCS